MVLAGLGVPVSQIMDPPVSDTNPVETVRLGAAALVLQLSVVTRKDDQDNCALQAM